MDMLSFSKDREPALESADLNETISDVTELMQSRAAELGVQLSWHPDSALPPVMIDAEGIHRAVLNIVTNAIDASEGASDAHVAVETDWDPRTSIAKIVISDNGIGIDEAEIPSIFQIFASSKGSRGTGLGLPVSQKIIREHGGRISVTSRPGHGATFVIELPMTKRADPKATSEGQTIVE
jgi:signal transduction histidine kinase